VAKVVVVVSAKGLTPTGTVKIRVGRKTYSGRLKGGKVTIRLARFKQAGAVRATVTYLGDSLTSPVSTGVRIPVGRATRR
jgi:hypothetical protein